MHKNTTISARTFLFAMFLVSGFCGLTYQVVWLRLAFAKFGIITPVISIVLSVFMLGLSLGSWISGICVRPISTKLRISPIFLYGIVEGLIGLGAFLVPMSFDFASRQLLSLDQMSSVEYLLASAIQLMLAILPWCFLMGMTFPLGIAFMETQESEHDSAGFSFLYLANVIGAMLGTVATALVLVEVLGFKGTLWVAAVCNFSIFAASVLWGLKNGSRPMEVTAAPVPADEANAVVSGQARNQRVVAGLLFATGFCSMAMEVVWTRAFTPITHTTIYAFAFLLTCYLLSTWVGSYIYRRHLSARRPVGLGTAVYLLALSSLLPLILNDPRLHATPFHTFVSLFPFCGLLGYLTPQLIDLRSRGKSEHVGSAYAINVLGCIVGPLFAGYLLLPFLGVKASLFILAIPLFFFLIWVDGNRKPRRLAALAVAITLAALSHSYEERSDSATDEIRRDYTATVISSGQGMKKKLLVNGYGMTVLTPQTKVMAHFPAALMAEKPKSVLIICFGMGTTFRSMVSWSDVDVTVVELVPSVPEAFGFYHQDATEVLRQPNAHVVVDDGRRYLARSGKKFDLIMLDPPPPVEAAGSSLLYSSEFYDLVKLHLSPGGVLQQWFPGGEARILSSVAKSVAAKFPYVRVFKGIDHDEGRQFLASSQAIPLRSAADMVSRTPDRAQKDLLEWFSGSTANEVYTRMLGGEEQLEQELRFPGTPLLSDDRPFNEYFLLRRIVPLANVQARTIGSE